MYFQNFMIMCNITPNCDILYNVSDTKYIFNVILACWHLLGSLFRSWIDINPIDADVNPCNILYT